MNHFFINWQVTSLAIYFYRVNEPYGCFSNFSPHGFELHGKWWHSSEHYFQAQKFVGTPHEEAIRLAKGPKEAATMGRSRKRPLRTDWEEVKDDVMRTAVYHKFKSHPNIRDILLSTENEIIIENSPIDWYWGCGADHTGKNRLGEILMEVREKLKSEQE